jgi:hypothetical protein
MAVRWSNAVAEAFADVSEGDYYVDLDGHWLTLKAGWNRQGGRIVHEWSARDMLKARKEIVRDTAEDLRMGIYARHGVEID